MADDAQTRADAEHGGGFSVDAKVRIEAPARDGLERLLRYCARPAFALERLCEIDPEHLVYESVKPGPGGSVSLLLTRGLPLWEIPGAEPGESDPQAQPAPDYEFDQRVTW